VVQRFGRGGAFVVAGLAATVAWAAAPASAATGLKYLSSPSKELPAGKIRATTVKCPDGSSVVGGGLTIKEPTTATGVHSSYPFEDGDPNLKPDGWRGVANSRSAGDKRLKVTVICSTSGRYTYTSVSTNTVPNGANTPLGAQCPTGEVVTGGGIQLSKGNTSLYVGASFPFDTDADMVPDDGWWAEANNESGSLQSMTVHAICARSGSYQYIAADSGAPAFGQANAPAICPDGTKVTGGGGDTETITTTAEITMLEPFPLDGSDSKPDDGWRPTFNNLSGVPLATTGFAVCRS
jgi:hypothetical protein